MRWRRYSYDELLARDKVNLDTFWLQDESLENSANLPEPDVLAAEIMKGLEAALAQFRAIAEDLRRGEGEGARKSRRAWDVPGSRWGPKLEGIFRCQELVDERQATHVAHTKTSPSISR